MSGHEENWHQNADRVTGETMDAISAYLSSQEGNATLAETSGMARGFLLQAAAGISAVVGGGEEGGERLYRKFTVAIDEYIDELNCTSQGEGSDK